MSINVLYMVQWSMATKHPQLDGFSSLLDFDWMRNTFYHPKYENPHVVCIWKIKPKQPNY